MTQNSLSSPRKPSMFKKLLALLLLLLFVAIGGGIIFYAKKTQQDMSLATSTVPAMPSLPESPLGAKDKHKAQALVELNGDNMVVVDNVPPPIPTDPNTIAADPTQNAEAQAAADLQSQSTLRTQTSLEKNAAMDKTTGPAIEALQKQVESLTNKLSDLEQKTTAIQESTKQGMQNDIALLLAANQLQTAISSGKPFSEALDMLRKLASKDSELDAILRKLQPTASIGIADMKTLQDEFQQATKNILQSANRKAGIEWARGWAGDGMVADTIGSLASVLIIRRTDDASDNSMDASISKIENALREQNLPLVDQALTSLPSDLDSPLFSQWREKFARKYVAEQSLQSVQNLILSRLQSNASVN